MIRLIICLVGLFSVEVFAEGATVLASSIEDSGFEVNVSYQEGRVIDELVTTMGSTSLVSLMFKKTYLRNLAKKLRPVSTTQFIGYVFERPHLITQMKKIHNSSYKWDSFTRSMVRGLRKQAEDNLFEIIPSLAKHTQSNKNILHHLAKEGKWNDFIVHILDRN